MILRLAVLVQCRFFADRWTYNDSIYYPSIVLRSNKTKSLCVSVSLFVMHDHKFEQISSKFSIWNPYSFWMVMGGLPSIRHCRSMPIVHVD